MKHAVFVAIYCEMKLYKDYEQVPPEERNLDVALVIMVNRWDGTIGFIGGMVDEDESDMQAVARELVEEAGHTLSQSEIKKLTPICSHELPDLTTHLMALEVHENVFKQIIANQHTAAHFLAEGSLMAVHFINYPHKRAFDNFMQGNFAPTVRDEIKVLTTTLGWNDKYHLYSEPHPTS